MADRFSNPSGNAGNWDTTATWATSDGGSTGASIPVDGDRAIIVAGDTVTNNGNHHVGSVQINSTGVLNGGGGAILYLDDDGNATIFQNDGSVTGTPRLHFTNSTSRNAKFGSGTFGRISVEFTSTATLTMTSALTSSSSLGIGGNSTLDTSGSNYALTIGDASIEDGGTLTGNASAISLGSLTIADGGEYIATSGTTTITGKNGVGYALQNSGTFTHNSGTVQTDHADPSALFGSGGCYNWIVNSATTIHDGNLTVYNNLTINASKLLKPDNNSRVFTVHGLTTIAGTFGLAANTGTHKLNHVDVTGTLQIGTNQTMDLTGLRNISGTVT